MKKLTFILCLFVLFNLAHAEEPEDACYSCHIEEDREEDLEDQLFSDYLNDVHVKLGFDCSDCHGGDPEAYDDVDEAMWDNDTYLGEISEMDEINVCGKCHSDPTFMRQYSIDVSTDQVKEYWTSQHGISLKNGVNKVATCTDCHNVHGIKKVDDPRSLVYPLNVPQTCAGCHSSESYMKGFTTRTNQYDGYVKSVHGIALLEKKDIYAPACNDCHGNHGAIPPTVGSIEQICGSCHPQNRDLFKASKIGKIFDEKGLPECESCHGNHAIAKPTDDLLNWETQAICRNCHPQGGIYKDFADELFGIIHNLDTRLEDARHLVEQAEIKGMEISDLYFKLDDAHNALIHTRTSIHSFDLDFVNETAAPGLKATEEAMEGATASLAEFNFRRKGLFGASLIISILALLMYVKLRQTEKEGRGTE